jgi:hypothetical protein
MDLQSIAPATKTVPLGSGTVEITGLSLRKLTQLIVRYPDLLALASGKADLANLLIVAPEAILAVFSVGVVGQTRRWWRVLSWFRGADEAAILRAFDEASTGQQIDIITQIYEFTFTGESARPFLEGVLKMIRAQSVDQNPLPETSAVPGPQPSNS